MMREYKRTIQRKKRQYFRKIADRLDNMHTCNPTKYWKFWKNLKNNTPKSCPIDIDTLSKFFKEESIPKTGDKFDSTFMGTISDAITAWDPNQAFHCNDIIIDTMNSPITMDELNLAIRKAKTGKASGPDMIPVEFYKHGGETVHNAILAVFNFVFGKGEYPQIWSEGLINPVYKAGKTTDPDNYRKITLLSTMGKLFDGILNNRLCFVKDVLNLNDPYQNGFKQGVQSTDNLFILNSIIEKYEAKKAPLYICFVDFKSAFDHINRSALLYKLLTQGFHGKFFRILRSLFDNTKSRVKWDNQIGELFENVYGVLQGGVISPSLFKSYIDDMRQYLGDIAGVNIGESHTNHLLQADDLILLSETRAGLQKLLNRLHTYCKRWHISLNVTKTKVMIFNDKYSIVHTPESFTYDDENIDITDSYKYLGVIVSSAGKRYAQHFDYLKRKASRAIIAAKIYIKRAVGGQLPTTLYLKVFDTQIRPILEYASAIWCPDKPTEELERIHLKYLKNILGVKQSTPTAAVLGETGRFPLHMRQQDHMLKLWVRLNKMPNNEILHKIYSESLHLATQGHNTWAGRVLRLIENTGTYTINSEPHPIKHTEPCILERELRERRYAQYIHNWQCELHQDRPGTKLQTYSLVKHEYRIEPHLLYVKDKRYQRAITKLRVSSHQLYIETGRHLRPLVPRQDRICIFCNSGEIDDEMHFLLRCEFHSESRRLLASELSPYIDYPSEIPLAATFQNIIGSKNQTVLTAVGKYIYNEFKNRSNVDAADTSQQQA